MRALSSVLFLGLVTSTGCKWTDFDDLEAETWVHTVEKPNSSSTDFGVALARGPRTSPGGGRLVALGTGEPQYFELGFASNGDADVPTATVLSTISTVTSLDIQPIVLADPASDEVALVAASSGGISVLHGAGGLALHSIPGPSQVDAATFMVPAGGRAKPAPLVGANGTVYGSYYDDTAAPAGCQLQDSAGMDIQIRGLGAVRYSSTLDDDILVWGVVGNVGKLLVYGGQMFNTGCTSGTLPGAEVVTDFVPSIGSQIIMVDATHALLVGHKEITGSESFLALYDVSSNGGLPRTPSIIGGAVTAPGLRTATVLDLGAQKYVLAGYPNEVVDGVQAGRVVGFPLSVTTGVGDAPALVLHDAQPEDDQAFGRAVTVSQFNGKPVIAVAADNEVFVYFRTTLYDETRQ